jgi:hypothetical protein
MEQSSEDSLATKKLLRKLDIHLLPPLMVIYFLSFMDRTNIGMLTRDVCLFENECADRGVAVVRQCKDPGNDRDPQHDWK